MWRDYNKKKHLYLDRSVLWWWYFWGVYFSLHSKMRNESHWWSIQNERIPTSFFFIWFNRNEIHQIDTFMRECETFNNLCNHFIHVAFESRQVIIKIEMLTITFARESCDCVARWILNCFGNSFNLFFFSSIRLWISWKQAKIMSSLYAAAIIWYNKDLFVHSLNNHTRFHFFFLSYFQHFIHLRVGQHCIFFDLILLLHTDGCAWIFHVLHHKRLSILFNILNQPTVLQSFCF